LNKELQNRFLILSAISSLGGSASKKDTLDYLENNDLINLTESDLAILKTRNEPKWRNELAFVRQHLVKENLLSNEIKAMWTLTEHGEDYLSNLYAQITHTNTYQRFTSKTVLENRNVVNEKLLSQNDSLNLIDDLKIENETIEAKVKLVKRYKKIVVQIKQKYNSKCQIASCGFTFKKANGDYYSEAHHLMPLSEQGSQSEDNVVILCPNHHRMFHYADVQIHDRKGETRTVILNGVAETLVYK
jgi:predicted HNH restriction endonuclease